MGYGVMISLMPVSSKETLQNTPKKVSREMKIKGYKVKEARSRLIPI